MGFDPPRWNVRLRFALTGWRSTGAMGECRRARRGLGGTLRIVKWLRGRVKGERVWFDRLRRESWEMALLSPGRRTILSSSSPSPASEYGEEKGLPRCDEMEARRCAGNLSKAVSLWASSWTALVEGVEAELD